MKPIGSFTPDNPFFLAPMEAVNCASFRVLCKRRGAGLIYTDMIDCDVFKEKCDEIGIQDAIKILVNPQEEEKPLCIQLGGGNLDNILFTIEHLQPYSDLFDFNVGCPLGYMLGKKGGVYLQKHSEQLRKIVIEMRKAITIPFMCKIRSGWDESDINAIEVAKMLEQVGVDAIAIHPRTRKQRAQGNADWLLARNVKEAIKIPLILSGDVTNAYTANQAFKHTKCDYIMLARGAQANPSVFAELKTWWETKEDPAPPEGRYVKTSISAKTDFNDWLELYARLENRDKFSEIKDHALWSAKGCQNNKEVTAQIMSATTKEELVEIFEHLKF